MLRNKMEGDPKDFKLGVVPERTDEMRSHRKAAGSQSSMSIRPLRGFCSARGSRMLEGTELESP